MANGSTNTVQLKATIAKYAAPVTGSVPRRPIASAAKTASQTRRDPVAAASTVTRGGGQSAPAMRPAQRQAA